MKAVDGMLADTGGLKRFIQTVAYDCLHRAISVGTANVALNASGKIIQITKLELAAAQRQKRVPVEAIALS